MPPPSCHCLHSQIGPFSGAAALNPPDFSGLRQARQVGAPRLPRPQARRGSFSTEASQVQAAGGRRRPAASHAPLHPPRKLPRYLTAARPRGGPVRRRRPRRTEPSRRFRRRRRKAGRRRNGASRRVVRPATAFITVRHAAHALRRRACGCGPLLCLCSCNEGF